MFISTHKKDFFYLKTDYNISLMEVCPKEEEAENKTINWVESSLHVDKSRLPSEKCDTRRRTGGRGSTEFANM